MEIDESEEEDTEQEGMHKEGASTPVYRSSTEPLEGEILLSNREGCSELTWRRCRVRSAGSYGESGDAGARYVGGCDARSRIVF